jgi:plastocyanin
LRSSRGFLLLAAVLLAGCAGGVSSQSSPPPVTTASTPTFVTTTAPLPPRTILVQEYEFGFKLSQQSISAGKVTFIMGNIGSLTHNFDLIGALDGPFLVPGQTATMTVTLKPGTYTYVCSVKYHAAEGMQGTFTVT